MENLYRDPIIQERHEQDALAALRAHLAGEVAQALWELQMGGKLLMHSSQWDTVMASRNAQEGAVKRLFNWIGSR